MANIIILITVMTPFLIAWLKYLTNKAKIQIEDKKNILKYKKKGVQKQ